MTINRPQLRVSHLSDPRQIASTVNSIARRTDPLGMTLDQLTVQVDRATDIGGLIRTTTPTSPLPTKGQGVEVGHNGLTLTAGIGSVISYDRANSTWQTLNVGGSTVALQAAGATTATVDNASVNLASGMVLKNNGTQVLGARQTGWAADTGTAKLTANATYTAGATLTYSATYVQSEQTAMATRMAAVEAALQNATQEMKAIKDALLTHGAIGA